MVELLSSGSDEGRTKAVEALTSLVCNIKDNMAAVMAAGALPQLVELLSSGSDKGRALAAGTLANLVCDDDSKDVVLASGALPPGECACLQDCHCIVGIVACKHP
jgi:hypothetical protein